MTTSEVCKVAPRTVCEWIDGGKLKGYRLPMSKHRRVLPSDLEIFMRANGMEKLWEESFRSHEIGPEICGCGGNIVNGQCVDCEESYGECNT